MVLAHVVDSWTRAGDRGTQAYYTLTFIGGVASPLFLFLAGVTLAISAAAKTRAATSHRAGAMAARRRGWEIFGLGLLFRAQAQVLGFGPLANLLRVDMLNTMGLSMVLASAMWQPLPRRTLRLTLFAVVTTAVAMATPLVRATPWLAALPDPLEAYLRPAGVYTGFPLFPWAGFLFAGVLVGDLLDAVRSDSRRQVGTQVAFALAGAGGIWLAWRASFEPALYSTARFWHDSPTFFFIRLGVVVVLLPLSSLLVFFSPESMSRRVAFLGKASLFAYWIHIELVYGIVAEPLKKALPLWGSVLGAAIMVVLLYRLAHLKNRWLERRTLKGPARVFSAVLR
jgi:acyltransferase